MLNCPSCSVENPETNKYCSDCGGALLPEYEATLTHTVGSREGGTDGSSPSDSSHHGRFLPGTRLANRYRIVSLLGKGGMGEVYRADDLKLGQTVALKFLPRSLTDDARRLSLLHSEVRLARQISHPNVCRVYDVGEGDGQHYLSMEFIDGEDLRSLLRRIGRLPLDKGIDIAHQLCSGLSAIHEKRVVHRDLKPANIMIDGRGRVRITDFGLAEVAAETPTERATAGTPAYMAPEQFLRGETSMQSDLYSLGLILYEVFTGKTVLSSSYADEQLRQWHESESSVARPSELQPDVEPGVERAILRCLEKSPQSRPSSAAAVAAGLPGGDPLAAALAAGETPSPEMVAAAGSSGVLRLGVATACLALLLIGLCVVAFVVERGSALGAIGREFKKPDILEETARTIAADLGYEQPKLGHSACGIYYRKAYLDHLKERDAPARWDCASIYFWYRQSPQVLSSVREKYRVELRDPPQLLDGMVSIRLDPQRRLLDLRAVARPEDDASGEPTEVDWSKLFEYAGLDIAKFESTDPLTLPESYADRRTAWEGLHAASDMRIRVEAASYHGQPVHFQLIWPDWTDPEPAVPAGMAGAILPLMLLAASAFLARRNLRLGRADRTGAFRIGLYVASIVALSWLFGASHIPDLGVELKTLLPTIMRAGFLGLLCWVVYLGLEPYVRRLWPESLISWGRLLSGRFRDPLVGRDLLLGTMVGACGVALEILASRGAEWLGEPVGLSSEANLRTLLGGRYLVECFLSANLAAVSGGLFIFLALVLLRLLLRNQWLAGAAYVLLCASQSVIAGDSYLSVIPLVVFLASLVFIFVRFGLLAGVATGFVLDILQNVPITSDFTAWYWQTSLISLAVVAAIGAYGFHASLGGRTSFSRSVI